MPLDEPQCFNDYRHGPATRERDISPHRTLLICARCDDLIKPTSKERA